MAKLTNQDQGDLLGIGARYVQKLRERGLPEPRVRESQAKWLARAKEWMAQNTAPKSRDGDPDDPTSRAHYEQRALVAAANLKELQLQKLRGEVHSKEQCYAETSQRAAALGAALKRLPVEFSRTLEMKTAEFIYEETERIIRAAMDAFIAAARTQEVQANGSDTTQTLDRRDARAAAVARPAAAAPVGRRASRAPANKR